MLELAVVFGNETRCFQVQENVTQDHLRSQALACYPFIREIGEKQYIVQCEGVTVVGQSPAIAQGSFIRPHSTLTISRLATVQAASPLRPKRWSPVSSPAIIFALWSTLFLYLLSWRLKSQPRLSTLVQGLMAIDVPEAEDEGGSGTGARTASTNSIPGDPVDLFSFNASGISGGLSLAFRASQFDQQQYPTEAFIDLNVESLKTREFEGNIQYPPIPLPEGLMRSMVNELVNNSLPHINSYLHSHPIRVPSEILRYAPDPQPSFSTGGYLQFQAFSRLVPGWEVGTALLPELRTFDPTVTGPSAIQVQPPPHTSAPPDAIPKESGALSLMPGHDNPRWSSL